MKVTSELSVRLYPVAVFAKGTFPPSVLLIEFAGASSLTIRSTLPPRVERGRDSLDSNFFSRQNSFSRILAPVSSASRCFWTASCN